MSYGDYLLFDQLGRDTHTSRLEILIILRVMIIYVYEIYSVQSVATRFKILKTLFCILIYSQPLNNDKLYASVIVLTLFV